MSTKNTTTSSGSTGFNFDPGSMAAYQKNLATNMPFLQSNVSNPYGSSAFQQQSTINSDQAAKMGQRGVSNVANNAAAMGYSTSGAGFNSMLQRASQNTNAMQAQGFRSAVTDANTRQMQSSQMLNSFQPLMTGSNNNSTSTSQQSGLGTWLPQLAGAAIGAATGGASTAAGAAVNMSGQGSASTIMPSLSPMPGFGVPGGSGGGMPSLFPNSGSMPSFYGQGYGY